MYVTQPQRTVVRELPDATAARPTQAYASCLQQREYQTIVTVGGHDVDAYGTACPQADGSWLRGPAKLPPQS